MSPSVLLYGNVDNVSVVKSLPLIQKGGRFLNAYESEQNKTDLRFQNLALKWFLYSVLVIIIYSNQSFNQSIMKFTRYYNRINLYHIHTSKM